LQLKQVKLYIFPKKELADFYPAGTVRLQMEVSLQKAHGRGKSKRPFRRILWV